MKKKEATFQIGMDKTQLFHFIHLILLSKEDVWLEASGEGGGQDSCLCYVKRSWVPIRVLRGPVFIHI